MFVPTILGDKFLVTIQKCLCHKYANFSFDITAFLTYYEAMADFIPNTIFNKYKPVIVFCVY